MTVLSIRTCAAAQAAHPSRCRPGTRSALPRLRARGREAEADWILRHSFPMRSIAELSRQLLEAGYPLGQADISEQEAIWYFTNGLALDTGPLNISVAVRRAPGLVITFEFDGEPRLGGYSVWVASDAAVDLKLQKSSNSVYWQDISRSQLTAVAGKGRLRSTLGVGSTLSASSHSGGGRGYGDYRLVATTDATGPTIDHVRFWLTGARHYRNTDRVVHLYNYLLAGTRKALRNTEEPQPVDTEATAESELIGPSKCQSR